MSTNAPPCAACGYGLRWVPESNGWGCDRCRQFYPASAPAQAQQQPQAAPVAAASPSQVQQAQYPQAQPQPGYPQQQPGYGQAGYAQQPPAYAPAVGGKKSKTGLIIAIGGIAVVGGIVAIVLATRGKGGGGGGGSDRDAVIKSALTAMADGDADALAKLQPDEDETKFMDCDKDKDKDDDKIERKKKKAREKLEKVASKAKGAKIEIDEVLTKKMGPLPEKEKDADDDDDKPRRKKKHKDDDDDDDGSIVLGRKGEKAGKGCKWKVDVRMQAVKVRIKLTKAGDDKERTKTVKVGLVEIDGGYYVADLPEIDGGGKDKDKDDKAGGGTGDMDDILDAMEGFKNKTCACKDKKCADDVQKDYMDYIAKLSKEHKADDKPDEEAMKKFMEIEKQSEECRKKLRSSGASDILKKYEAYTDKICACTGDKASECARAAADEYAKTNASADKPDPDAMAEFARKSEPTTKRLTECMTRIAKEGASAAQTPDAPTTGGGGGTVTVPADYAAPPADMAPECVAIRDAMAKMESCSKMTTPAMHDAYKKGWDAYIKMWTSTTAAGRKTITETCAKTVATMKTSLDAACKQ